MHTLNFSIKKTGKDRKVLFHLLFDPRLQFVHLLVELLQALRCGEGARPVCSHLFEGLPLLPQLAELLLHGVRCGVRLADQPLAQLLTQGTHRSAVAQVGHRHV